MAKEIVFTNTIGEAGIVFPPRPAASEIPNWYKELVSYRTPENKKVPDGQGLTTATIKKCMPVFDAFSSGYLLFTPVDIYVSQKEDPLKSDGKKIPVYEWPSLTALNFHPIDQAPNHPQNTGHTVVYPKFMNPWSIKTPKGYSCLFVPPLHRESVFTPLSGIVDTDTYVSPVNFPFVLNDINFEGTIPAGTPMIQVIPFKRDSWKMNLGSSNYLTEVNHVNAKLRLKLFDGYKLFFRAKKEYR